jgi:hypothetical protein
MDGHALFLSSPLGPQTQLVVAHEICLAFSSFKILRRAIGTTTCLEIDWEQSDILRLSMSLKCTTNATMVLLSCPRGLEMEMTSISSSTLQRVF